MRMSMPIRNPLNTHTQYAKFLRIIVWLQNRKRHGCLKSFLFDFFISLRVYTFLKSSFSGLFSENIALILSFCFIIMVLCTFTSFNRFKLSSKRELRSHMSGFYLCLLATDRSQNYHAVNHLWVINFSCDSCG